LSPLSLPRIECIESKENYAKYSAEPLEKGVGTTLGNALRRMLLSSLPGAAVTSVKIEGIHHEFSTIPNLKEDTIEFLLNVKGIRLKAHSGRPGKLILEVARKGEIRASDIQETEDFEIVNPDLYLATLDEAEPGLYVEMNVECGEGYRQAENDAGAAVGIIPVDAVFSPIRKVNYNIEPLHIGRETSRERLFIEIWSDGTISPVDALSKAAEMTIQQLTPFANMADVSLEPEEYAEEAPAIPDEKYNMLIEELDLSVRTMNSLRRGGIATVGDLLSKGERELLSLRNFGQKSRQEVEEKLRGLGLNLSFSSKADEETEDELSENEENNEDTGEAEE
jgi:DNA-directed RNA polymerase subunit alpha